MTKREFQKAKKIIKKHNPFLEFELSEGGRIYQPGKYGSSADFVELSVDTLFDIALNNEK